MLSLGRGVTRPSQQFQIKLNKLKCDRRNQRGMLENVLPRISLTGLSISTEPELSNSATFYRFHWRFIKLVASRTPISRLGRMSLTINCESVSYLCAVHWNKLFKPTSCRAISQPPAPAVQTNRTKFKLMEFFLPYRVWRGAVGIQKDKHDMLSGEGGDGGRESWNEIVSSWAESKWPEDFTIFCHLNVEWSVMNFPEIFVRFGLGLETGGWKPLSNLTELPPDSCVIVVAYYQAIAIIKRSFPVDKDLFINKPTNQPQLEWNSDLSESSPECPSHGC